MPTNVPTQRPTKNPTSNPTVRGVAETSKPTGNPNNALGNSDSESEDEAENIEAIDPGSVSTLENLSCETAMLIQPNSAATEGAIFSFPLDALDGLCLSGLETVGGWYQVIGNGKLFRLTACSLDVSKTVGISVFTGDCSESKCIEHHSRQAADCETGNGYAVSFTTQQGTPYDILVSGLPVGLEFPISSDISVRRRIESKPESDFRLEFTEATTSENSKCGSSVPITIGTPVEGSTLGLLTTYKTCHNTEKSGAWYTVEGGTQMEDGNILYEANTCDFESNFYNTMSVFRGDSCGSHECVDVNVLPCPNGGFGQKVYWSSTLKETYQIFVHSSDSVEASLFGAGSFEMSIIYNNRLANDQCTAAIEVELNGETVKGTTSGSKPDMNSIENSSCGTGGAGAWHRINGTGAIFQASTCSSETDHKTGIQVYSGECEKLVCIDSAGKNKALCNDGKASVVNFETQVGVDYYILVTPREGKTGNFGLQITEIQPPENNECSAAMRLENFTDALGSTLQATSDFPSGYDCGVPLDTSGVWYEIEGTGKAMEISTCQKNDFDSAISVFKGSCGNRECITGASAFNPKCTDGQGVVTSFLSDKKVKYLVYIHGKSDSPTYMGEFIVSYSEFDILETNEFCPLAHSIPTDGSRVQVSTEDASRASTPSSSCGVPIINPGFWYTFEGSGQPMQISACSEDDGDTDVSISVFAGGPGGCDSLTCLTGSTFIDNVCIAPERRSLQSGSSSAMRLMTENRQKYFIFIHGTEGGGDFDLFVWNENLAVFGTAAPTVSPIRYGKDLHRWVPVRSEGLTIETDFLVLDMVEPPTGNATIRGYTINYVPPYNLTGEDSMTLDGCNGEECFRFDIIISIMGEKVNPEEAGENNFLLSLLEEAGRNNSWIYFLLLLLFLFVPLLCFAIKRYRENNPRDEGNDDSDNHESDTFNDDNLGRDESSSLVHRRTSNRSSSDPSSKLGRSTDDDDNFSDDYDDSD